MEITQCGESNILDVLARRQTEHASLLLSEGSPLDLQRAGEVAIDNGQCKVLQNVLIRNCKLDIDKHFWLHRALFARQEEIARWLIESGADVNNCLTYGQEDELHYSTLLPLQLSLFCSRDMTHFLVNSGADVNKQNALQETTLISACRKPVDDNRVVFLLEQGANIHVNDRHEESALHCAAQTGNARKVSILIDHGADIEATTPVGKTVLMCACYSYVGMDCFKILLEAGASLNPEDQAGRRALHFAIETGETEKVKLLIDHGAEIEAKDYAGKTALMSACDDSVPASCLEILLAKRANPNSRNKKGYAALNSALKNGEKEKVTLLINHGADPEAKTALGHTALIFACHNPVRVDCLRVLLNKGANTNVTDSKGQTPLHLLVKEGSCEKVKLLIEYGADFECRTAEEKTPYLIAAETMSYELIQLFYQLGADISKEDRCGQNAVMLAVRNVSRSRVKLDINALQCLVDQGVSVNHRDKNGWTALMIAAQSGQEEAVMFLLKSKADVYNVGTLTGITNKEMTALSISLENLQSRMSACVEELIRHGAVNSLPTRYNGCLYMFIKNDERKLVHLLLSNGMAPAISDSLPGKMIDVKPVCHFGNSITRGVTSLGVALAAGRAPIIRYLLENLMLCPCDILGQSYFVHWRHLLIFRNKSDIVKLMDKFYAQPLSLFQLSFVTVSHALGGVPGRVDRINSLHVLPTFIKDQLLFKSPNVSMDITTDGP